MEASMKYIALIAVLSLLAIPAAAQFTCTYSWEDGGTVLGYYGNMVNESNVTGPQTGQAGDQGMWTCPGAYDGEYYLHVAESPHSSTPQVYIAWITGLVAGDVVTADYWAFDNIDSDYYGYPSCGIWAHYATNTDVNSYQGSAGMGGGTGAYTSGIGWENLTSFWTFGVDGSPYAGAEAIVVEMRLYSSPATSDPNLTDYWADLVKITAPTTACVTYPSGTTPVEDTSWGNIKALYR
jgi:hypothetical protein